MRNPFTVRYSTMGDRMLDYLLRGMVIMVFVGWLIPLEILPWPADWPLELYPFVWAISSAFIGTVVAIPLSRLMAYSIKRGGYD